MITEYQKQLHFGLWILWARSASITGKALSCNGFPGMWRFAERTRYKHEYILTPTIIHILRTWGDYYYDRGR